MIEILPHKIATPLHRIVRQKVYERWTTMKEFDEDTRISHNTVANVCSGKYSPRLDTIALILKALGLDLWVIDPETGDSWRLKL